MVVLYLIKYLTTKDKITTTNIVVGVPEKERYVISILYIPLKISMRTVHMNRMQLMERIDIHDIAGLICYVISIGWVKNDQ